MDLAALRTNIKTRLGYPAINIELDTTQIDIYVADAVKKFIETHYDGLDEGYIFLNVTKDTQTYTLANSIHSVLEAFGVTTNFVDNEPLMLNPFIFNGSLNVIPDVLDLEVFRQSYAMYSNYNTTMRRFSFNATEHVISFQKIPERNETLALHVHVAPDTYTNIYENVWFQKYATALCKYAWGQNIAKYGGATLPGGVSLNYDLIIAEAKEEKLALEEELYNRYQEPIDFLIG